MLRIWGRRSSINVQKVLWAADELLLAYERIDAGGAFGGLDTPAFRAMNPNARIPVIEDDGFVLWESNTIVRYLAAKHGIGGLHPERLAARADAERWMDWQLATMLPEVKVLFHHLVRAPLAERDPAAAERARAGAEVAWRLLDAHLADRPYVSGARFTMADIPLGAFAHRWKALPIERPRLVGVDAWYGRLIEREPFRRHVMLPLE
jgi:glutathione S-transferase